MSHDMGFCETIRIDRLRSAHSVGAIPATSSHLKGHHHVKSTTTKPGRSCDERISSDPARDRQGLRPTRWSANKLERIEIAADYSRSLGTSPSFDVWEAHRIDWVNGYVAANPNNTGNAADAAWTDFAGVIKALYALTKPKSDNLGADKKREERAKKAEALLAKYQGKTAADLRGMRAAALQSAAKGSELAEKIAAELKKVLRVKTSAEDAAIGEERKGLRTQVKTAAGKCTDLDKLRAALEILDDETELEFITQVEADEDFAGRPTTRRRSSTTDPAAPSSSPALVAGFFIA
jgi:hypothetical protein